MTTRAAGSDRILARLLELHPKRIDLTLGRMERLLAALGHPERDLPPVIHVAGTNGKGSVTAYLKGMLQAEGARVHAYTSPHLVSFRERIEIAGAPIEEDRLAALLEEVEGVNAGAPITFFEVTTAAAFLAFSREPADALLLEVGLGGRLDATNVVDAPKVSVITPVALDHQDFLGETLGQIAAEKAGILKNGVACVTGPQQPEAGAVIEARAREVGATLITYGADFMAHEEQGRFIYQDTDGLMDLPMPRLEGRHQLDNAAVAIAAAKAFFGRPPAPETIAAGLRTVSWPGRLQRLKEGPLVDALSPEGALDPNAPDVWIDGGHNPAAAAVLAGAMADMNEKVSRPLYLIVAMGANKDPAGFFNQFQGLARRVIAVPLPAGAEGHEGFAPRGLAAAASEAGISAGVASGPADALAQALADAEEPPRILITGSLYLVGDILKQNG